MMPNECVKRTQISKSGKGVPHSGFGPGIAILGARVGSKSAKTPGLSVFKMTRE